MHFGDESGAPFGDENASQNPVWAVLVLDVFLRPHFSGFLDEMGAPRLQFGSHFDPFREPEASGKTAQSV